MIPRVVRQLFTPPPSAGVLGVFAHLDAAVNAIREIKPAGFAVYTLYSPIPRHEQEEAIGQPTSPVRISTLIDGIVGCPTGAWSTIYMSYDWPLVVGGKPVGSIPPYTVIMFEMTVLFGALTTLLGIAYNSLFAARRRGTIEYDPRFSNDRFGIFVNCGPDRAPVAPRAHVMHRLHCARRHLPLVLAHASSSLLALLH